jgi:hypothetical protein
MTAASGIPAKFTIPFAQNDAAKVEIPATTADPTRASQSLGFPPLTGQPPESGGVPPQLEDFNGAINQIARTTWWGLLLGGRYPFDSAFASDANVGGYPNGAVIASADLRGNWISTADNNVVNPDTSATPASWVPGFQYGSTAITGLTNTNVTLTPAQAAKNTVTLAGTLTGNVQIIVPAWQKSWTVTNNTSGAFTVTVKTAAGTGIVIPQNGAPTLVRGDGTNVTQVGENVATAVTSTQAAQFGQVNPGRLLRTSVYAIVSGVQQVWVVGSAGFTTTGASTFTQLTNSTLLIFEAVGGGASGGGAAATSASQIAVGSGGQSGAYVKQPLVGSGYTAAITCGTAGPVGAAGASGSSGTATTVGTLLTCPGGQGGNAGLVFANTVNVYNSESNAQLVPVIAGLSLSLGGWIPPTGGIYIAPSYIRSGNGGGSPLGTGGVGRATGAGQAAQGFGSGGAGACSAASAAATVGGAAQGGAVIVYEYA